MSNLVRKTSKNRSCRELSKVYTDTLIMLRKTYLRFEWAEKHVVTRQMFCVLQTRGMF